MRETRYSLAQLEEVKKFIFNEKTFVDCSVFKCALVLRNKHEENSSSPLVFEMMMALNFVRSRCVPR